MAARSLLSVYAHSCDAAECQPQESCSACISNPMSLLHMYLPPVCRTDKCVIATAGFQADMKALQKMLQVRFLTLLLVMHALGSHDRLTLSV